jgi:hypothetical protein
VDEQGAANWGKREGQVLCLCYPKPEKAEGFKVPEDRLDLELPYSFVTGR